MSAASVAPSLETSRLPAQEQRPEGASWMPDTRWSLVRRVQAGDTTLALRALGDLMQIYWKPLYAYARRRGESPADAEDAVQGFCEMLIARSTMHSVSSDRGRLRSFMLTAFERYLIDQWERRSARKRGGGQQMISLDQEAAEQRYLHEPVDHLTPAHIFHRQWVYTLLGQAMEALRRDYEARGKGPIFEALRGTLDGTESTEGYASIGERFGLNENAVKQAVFRMRTKYREMVRSEIAETVSDPADVDLEFKDLMLALSGATPS